MERRALVLALALMVPLALYGIPYAYATTSSTDYAVVFFLSVRTQDTAGINVPCNAGDYAVSGGYLPGFIGPAGGEANIAASYPTLNGIKANVGETPNGWFFVGSNNSPLVGGGSQSATVWAVCQTPITVAGIGVPQFGSLYVAIALGAVAYFLLARRYAIGKTKGLAALRNLEG